MTKEYSEAMVDIETLDVEAPSIVLSAGIVLFNLNDKDTAQSLKGDRCLYTTINPTQQVEVGRSVSPSTVIWHFGQEHSSDTRTDGQDIRFQLYKLSEFIGDRKLWGNGSSFDNVILRNLFKQFDVPFTNYWNDQDLRTLKRLSGVKDGVENKTPHNALADAKAQVLSAQKYYKALKK